MERKTDEPFDISRYLTYTNYNINEIESFTGKNWDVKDYPDLMSEINGTQDALRVHFPAYEYNVYLRQHGFPSPLLDWTTSPYIAAYFAFFEKEQNETTAVFAYVERPQILKSHSGGEPTITVLGPYVTTHKRHFVQKSWYTIATEWSYEEKSHTFCRHSNIFDRNSEQQDVLIKITFPSSDRKEALLDLNDFNINHFPLFQTEESLIKSLEIRQFDMEEF